MATFLLSVLIFGSAGAIVYTRLKSGKNLPLFTSCCPGWVRFLKSQYPDMVPHLSTSKSPHQMFGAITKTWFAEKLGVDPAKLYTGNGGFWISRCRCRFDDTRGCPHASRRAY